MQYIEPENFLKESEKVQRVLREWWKPEMNDLFFRDFGNSKNNFMNGIYISCIGDVYMLKSAVQDKSILPLLTEGQLRTFVEEKTNSRIEIWFEPIINKYYFYLNSTREDIEDYGKIPNLSCDILHAYWEVACKIAKEEIKKNEMG